jgi:NAD(P)-dependent dehydrogenase (short-subunit alcohol dehydrogenase family)
MYQSAYLYGINSLPGRMIAVYLLKRGMTLAAQFADSDQYEAFISTLPGEWQKRCIPFPFLPKDTEKEKVEKHLETVAAAMNGFNLYIHAGKWEDELATLERQPEAFVEYADQRLRNLFFYCQAVGRIMARQKRGQIIIPLLSDALHSVGFPSSPVYNQGAISFVKSLAKELSPYGISVNVFEFGYYLDESSSPSSRKDRQRFELFALKPPVPRLAEAMEGLGLLLDYGIGMSGQIIQWGYGTPSTTL